MKGDFTKARAEYDRLTAQDATDEFGRAARLNRANLDADSGEFDRARAEYDALLAEDLLDMAARHSRAILELRMGQASLAERDLDALMSMPGLGAKIRGECLAERAQARLLLGKASDALADACGALRIRPGSGYDRLVQRAALAARRYDQLRISRPESVALLPLRGTRLDAELRDAAAELGRIVAVGEESAFGAGLTRAAILAGLGDSRAARAAADRAVLLARGCSAEASLVRARVLSFGGDRRGASAEVQHALALFPDEPRLLELRGSLRLAEGDARGAIADYDRASPASGPRDEVHFAKAEAFFALGDYQAAVTEWSLALRRDPELPEAYLGRARSYFLLHDWDQGLADLEQAAAWAHGDPRIEAAVAASYLQCLPRRRDRLPRFLVHLRRAADDFWHSLDGRFQLAAGLN
jgi:tetratricopeptide (TPR) repeat protein